MCCGLRQYTPYHYTKTHAQGVCDAFTQADKSICCRIAAVAYHALATLICALFIDTLLSACRVVYVLVVPDSSPSESRTSTVSHTKIPVPDQGRSSTSASRTNIPVSYPRRSSTSTPLDQTLTGSRTSTASRTNIPASHSGWSSTSAQIPPTLPQPALPPSAPMTQPVRDPGLDAPTWRISGNGAYSLDQLAPFRFHKAVEGEALGAFSFSLTTLPLFNTNGENEDCFAIKIECPAIETLKQSSQELRAWLSEVSLHCGESAGINLADHLRADYAMHPAANKYRFIYPIQPDPDPEKARRLIAALAASPVPDFIKNLMLIGGYVYYLENDTGTTLLQVKPFSASADATEILATGRALDAEKLLPKRLIEGFKRGVAMTDGKWQPVTHGTWKPELLNLICSSVNKITAPSLVAHLTHFGYVPQSLYEDTPRAKAAAPYGAFLYRTKTGMLQLVPIGGNFGDVFPKPLAQTNEQTQQIYKQHTLASIFYPSGGTDASLIAIEGLFPAGIVVRQGNRMQLHISGDAGVRYAIQTINGRAITIYKSEPTGQRQEKQARIDQQGQIDGADAEEFTELLNEVYPHLMKKMLNFSAPTGKIYTVKESIDFAPTEHLQALINIMTYGGNLSVNYFDLFLHAYIAIDAGGVRRDYISKLFLALLRHSDLFEEDDGFYKLKANLDVSNEKQRAVLQNIGAFLAWILNQNGAFPVGRSFASQFFKWLSTCFVTNIKNEKLIKMFSDHYKKIGDIDYKDIINCLNSSQPPPVGDRLRDRGLNILLIDTFDIDKLSELTLEAANAKIEQNWNEIRSKAMGEMIQQMKDLLAPYQVIADFLQHNLRVALPGSEVELDLRIQGQTDLAAVRDAIVYNGPILAVHKKAAWIRGWLNDGNVGRFLLAATGSPALGPGQRVSINSMSVDAASFWPVYHACSKSIDMPHGHLLDSADGAHKTCQDDPTSFVESFEQGLAYALAANGFTQS